MLSTLLHASLCYGFHTNKPAIITRTTGGVNIILLFYLNAATVLKIQPIKAFNLFQMCLILTHPAVRLLSNTEYLSERLFYRSNNIIYQLKQPHYFC